MTGVYFFPTHDYCNGLTAAELDFFVDKNTEVAQGWRNHT